MFSAYLVKSVACRVAAPLSQIFQALTDSLVRVGTGGKVEHVLIRGGVLHDGFGLAIHGEKDRSLGVLEPSWRR